jgi:hypothetical protein
MLDREKIVAVLKKRFPGSGADQVAAAANAIVGLEDEWEEIPAASMHACDSACRLQDLVEHGASYKIFRRASPI